jgi:hypothetical protein
MLCNTEQWAYLNKFNLSKGYFSTAQIDYIGIYKIKGRKYLIEVTREILVYLILNDVEYTKVT